jgi:molybdopterin synthase catalytic subunit
VARIGVVRDDLMVRLTTDALDPSDALAFVSDPAAGGTVLFAGTVRDRSDMGAVVALEYESWDERVLERMEAIGEELFERWPVRRAALLHRTGQLDVGAVSVLVGCSAPHRAEAFEAARHGIERIKSEVPIWKKERLTTGDAHWVMGS